MNKGKAEQNTLIIKAMHVARQLQRDYGERIKQLYALENTQPDIVSQLSIELEYNINRSTAITAVQMALSGHKSYFNLNLLPGLLSESELEAIAEKHILSGCRKRIANKLGVFGWSDKRLAEHGRKSGKKTYTDGTGIHGMSTQERSLAGKKGGTASAKKRGVELWSQKGLTEETKGLTEIERAYQLTTQREYLKQGGRYNGKPDISKILHTINLEYHQGRAIRTQHALKRALEKERNRRV